MSVTGRRYSTMKLTSTAFLIIALVIVVNQSGAVTVDDNKDLVAEEAKNRAVTIIDGPKNLVKPTAVAPPATPEVQTVKPEQRPPSKPPISPEIAKNNLIDVTRPYYSQLSNLPLRSYYKTPQKLPFGANSLYQFPRVIPLPPNHKNYYVNNARPLQFVASTYSPTVVTKSPKFSIPVQTINGIRTDIVKPPRFIVNATTTPTTTTTETTTTAKLLRTKRIWPKRDQLKKDSAELNETIVGNFSKITNATEGDKETSASQHRVRYVQRNPSPSTTPQPTTKRSYRPVTRSTKRKVTTLPTPANFTKIEPNDWVPIVPSHYRKINRIVASRRSDTVRRRSDTASRRSDIGSYPVVDNPYKKHREQIYPGAENPNKNLLYLQSFGLLPLNVDATPTSPTLSRKRMVLFKPKRHLHSHYSGYNTRHLPAAGDLQPEESHHSPHVVTKIKHHHHHHHHRYIKTVEKKVPIKVEVPKPYAVAVEKQVPVPVEKIKVVEKRVPYPVTVEKKVPYPIGIKVPHPVPVKVVEKEYVPKPYPVVHHVPFVKHVKVPHPVPYPVEKRVPYPVEVQVAVPVDRPVPVPVTVEKQVPYPVPVRVLVPQPYPVEKRVPYPVKKEVEVIKHIPVRVPYPQPYPVKVPQPVPVPVEKRVPYPVEVEKKVPVPVEVFVPQRVEVEKKVPVYVPKPYPVEKKVPYPVKVPVPVRVAVPVEVPVYIHEPYSIYNYEQGSYGASTDSSVQHTVTAHGNAAHLIQSRSDDNVETTTTSKSTQSR